MNKSSIIYLLSIIAILSFCISQIHWLDTRYTYELDRAATSIESKTDSIMESYKAFRKESTDTITKVVTKITKDKAHPDRWMCKFNVMSVDAKNPIIQLSDTSLAADDTHGEILYIDGNASEQEVYANVYAHVIELRNPFSIETADSLLSVAGLSVVHADTLTASFRKGGINMDINKSWINPTVILTYPYDVLGSKGATFTLQISVSTVIESMAATLILTLGCGLLLIICLVLQMVAIHKQRQIARMRNDYIASVLHELKRPLYTLKMFLSFLTDPVKSKNERIMERIVDKTRDEVDSLSQYFSKLRDLTCSSCAALPLKYSISHIKDIVEKCVTGQTELWDKKISFKIDIPADMQIEADANYFRSMISNLVENAIKYSYDDTHIRLEATADNGYVTISVCDNGWGIPSSHKKKLFSPYYRGVRATKENLPGLGLGLSYVLKIVKAHHGSVRLNNIMPHGTEVKIILPQNCHD